jgi:putative toxin-antitoxin system antitoxin component (TIGR02293 family)
MLHVAKSSSESAESEWLRRVATWDDQEADAEIRRGLPVRVAAELQELLRLTDEETAHIIGRSRSTYARYRSQDKDLGTAESERAVRLTRLLGLAAETFGSLSKAVDWMRETNAALGGNVPLEMAETDPGATIVRDLLLGLQHGHPA